MFNYVLSPFIKKTHLIYWVLLTALVFAALHVAVHNWELDSADLTEEHQCEACRLNHLSAASLPLPSLAPPLRTLAYIVPDTYIEESFSPLFHLPEARAPPLS